MENQLKSIIMEERKRVLKMHPHLTNDINGIPWRSNNKVKKFETLWTTSSNDPLQEWQENSSHIQDRGESILQYEPSNLQ